MENYYEILRSCPLFDDIESENMAAMLGCLGASTKRFAKRETIIDEGSTAKYVGILLSGRAQITSTDFFGNRSIVAEISPTELFGESFACADVKSVPIDVVATEDCEILLIDCKKITHTCARGCDFHRTMIYNLMKVVARKNLVFHQKISITSKRTTREKLMAYLMIQAKRAQSDSFVIPFDRQELADYLEVDRSGLSAEISKLRNEGVLECERNYFKLL